ncbi:hypothetical protein HC928_22395, partial [bacterium]|nr:hypothetical protein [bacterium]
MLGVTATKDDPDMLEKPLFEGRAFTVRMWFFNLIPAWLHTLHVAELNHERREMLTHERGFFITAWNHRICVEPLGEDRTHYTDEIENKAGVLTVPVVGFAHIFYRYRQSRWRKLARTLG